MAYSSLEGKNVVIIGGTAGRSMPQRWLLIRVPKSGRPGGRARGNNRQVSGQFEVRQADTPDAAALDAIFNEVGKIDHLCLPPWVVSER